jgi:hypothetical protein
VVEPTWKNLNKRVPKGGFVRVRELRTWFSRFHKEVVGRAKMSVESKEAADADGMKIILKQQELDNDDPPPMEDQDETVEESVSTWRVCLMGTINNQGFAVILIFLTIYALFGDDIRLAASEKPDDAIFFTISIIALAFFTVELLVNMVAKPGYVRTQIVLRFDRYILR